MGNPASIAPTSDTPIRDLDVTYGDHRHYIGRNIVWVRESGVKHHSIQFLAQAMNDNTGLRLGITHSKWVMV